MKNLKKLSRKNLKNLKGSGGGDSGDYFPQDPPMPGEPYNCGCNYLAWCEKMSACVHINFYSAENCHL